MTGRLLLVVAVFAVVALVYLLWRRPPSRLSRLGLADLGVRGPAIIQFSTRLCAPCKAATPHLEAAARASRVRYVQVDIGERPEVARKYGIRTVPTIAVARRDGDVVGVWTSLPSDGEIVEAARRARSTVRRPGRGPHGTPPATVIR